MKQFVLACDEQGLAAISSMCNGTVKFLEVQGMNLHDKPFMLLMTPVVEQDPPPEISEQA